MPEDCQTRGQSLTRIVGHRARHVIGRWHKALDERGGGLLRVLRDKRLSVSFLMLVLAVFVAAGAPLFARHDPEATMAGPMFSPPSWDHPFGTDQFGRDLLSRVIFGMRISMIISALVLCGTLGIGLPLGLVSGYVGGVFDLLVSRVIDVLLAFPPILLALVLMTVLSPGLNTAVLALVVIYAPRAVRFVRGATIAERNEEYVFAARVVGASRTRILVRHVLPNIVSAALVMGTITMAYAVLAEASLSFLGVGAQPPTPSLGRLVLEATTCYSEAAYMAILPGLAITYVVLAFNLLGDGLRDQLDPRLRRRLQ